MIEKPRHLRKDDLHLHLYGCLAAADLWEIGLRTWRQREERLGWYALEYKRAFGKRPLPAKYWLEDDGKVLLREHYACLESCSFAQFQAKFNLSIALCPLDPQDMSTVKTILESESRSDAGYREYRLPVPAHFRPFDMRDLWTAITKLMSDFNSPGGHEPRLVVSLPRDPQAFRNQYQILKSWQSGEPELSQYLVGIDFSGFEENLGAAGYAPFFAQVRQDNDTHPRSALALLVHAGETFEFISLASAARRVYQAAAFGAHRIGHGVALGYNPALLAGLSGQETIAERRDHLTFLLEFKNLLALNGYDVDTVATNAELAHLATRSAAETLTFTYDERLRADTLALQGALLTLFKKTKVVLEVCPTSNLRLCRLPSMQNHPIQRFVEQGLLVTLGADDPGLFETNLRSEEEACLTVPGLHPSHLDEFRTVTAQSRSAQLAGRLGS